MWLRQLLHDICCYRERKAYQRGERRRYIFGGGWGDRIEWTKTGERVSGWKSNRPRKGDFLIVPMKSGKEAVYVFEEIEYCHDPTDMFFADVIPICYA